MQFVLPLELIIFGIIGGGISIAIFFAIWIVTLNNVPLYEAHILTSRKGKVRVFDGKGRYHFFPHLQKRIIMPKTIMEIKSPRIKHHDVDKLPFGVELACKIQITDAEQAAMTLGNSSIQEIRNYVEETIISAMRSQAMQRNLLDIMRNRDELEDNIYRPTHDALAKIGIEVLMFDIINIVDVEDSNAIKDLERVKSAELARHARESEAIHRSKASIIEAQQTSEAEVVRQDAVRKQETARIQQEITVAEKRQDLMAKEMEVRRIEREKDAQIQKQQLLIRAQAEAERRKRIAEADAEAILIKSKAQAEAIRLKMEAEAEGTEKLAAALEKLDEAGLRIKLGEIHSHMTIESARALAEGMRNNTKIFLPINSGDTNGNGNQNMTSILTSLIPGLTVLDEFRKITKEKKVDSESKKSVAESG